MARIAKDITTDTLRVFGGDLLAFKAHLKLIDINLTVDTMRKPENQTLHTTTRLLQCCNLTDL